tara:strand:- start:480 stop:1244 length:765 start_codon:yes stop_codon:yes gene_type:complete
MNKANNLNGLCVLNTRPSQQSLQLTKAIHELGGRCIELPALKIEPTKDWLQHMPALEKAQHVIFVSPNAVHYYFQSIHQHHITWPSAIHVIAVGHGTAQALKERGLDVHAQPEIADSEHLLQLDCLQSVNQRTILLIKGEGGRSLLSQTLLKRGAALISLCVYRRVSPHYSPQYIKSLWQDDAVDIILFTSVEAMQNIFNIFGDQARVWLCGKPCIVLSERLAKHAAALGIRDIKVSRYDCILSTLDAYAFHIG